MLTLLLLKNFLSYEVWPLHEEEVITVKSNFFPLIHVFKDSFAALSSLLPFNNSSSKALWNLFCLCLFYFNRSLMCKADFNDKWTLNPSLTVITSAAGILNSNCHNAQITSHSLFSQDCKHEKEYLWTEFVYSDSWFRLCVTAEMQWVWNFKGNQWNKPENSIGSMNWSIWSSATEHDICV